MCALPGRTAIAGYLVMALFGTAFASAISNPTPPASKPAVSIEKSTPVAETQSVAQNQPAVQPETAKPQAMATSTSVAPGHKLKVSFIDVGQADAILVQTSGKNMLIDTGNAEDANTVASYLNSQGVKTLDYLILTHPHEDHIGSASNIIRTFDVKQIVMPRKDANTHVYTDMINAMKEKGLKAVQAKAGLKLDLGPEVDAMLVAPNADSYEDVNSYSAVIKLVYGKNSFLFTGDAHADSESQMISAGFDLKADVLKVGHHGSDTSTSPAFLSKVAPKYAVISVGVGNSYGHPHAVTISKLKVAGIKVYRTDESGTVVAESDGTNITFNTLGKSVQPRAPSQPSTSQPAPTQTPVPAPVPTPTTPAQSDTGSLGVTAQISNPSPSGGSETLTATVTKSGHPAQGVNVNIIVHYKSTTRTFSGTTDANGVSHITWSIGSPSKGFRVVIDVNASYDGLTASTQTSFTPQ
jgi:competence protein ComEC